MSTPMLYLTKRPNRIYYICIKNSNGTTQWKSTGCTNRLDASNVLNEYQELIEKGLEQIGQTQKLSDFLALFYKVNELILRERTIKDYRRFMTMYMGLAGDKPIDKYTSGEFDRIRSNLITKGWCVETTNIFTRSIKSVFGFADRQNILDKNPSSCQSHQTA